MAGKKSSGYYKQGLQVKISNTPPHHILLDFLHWRHLVQHSRNTYLKPRFVVGYFGYCMWTEQPGTVQVLPRCINDSSQYSGITVQPVYQVSGEHPAMVKIAKACFDEESDKPVNSAILAVTESPRANTTHGDSAHWSQMTGQEAQLHNSSLQAEDCSSAGEWLGEYVSLNG